jgi:hypothetical protein
LFGHSIYPPARRFRPRRDVDLFLDRSNKSIGRGYCYGVDFLKQLFEKDAALHRDANRHQQITEFLLDVREDFVNWLGETQYMSGLQTIPVSRFSGTNANGLWEYSPYLCGVGLMEGLELAYSTSFLMMDRIPEPFCIVHLHNMLVQRGYITKPVGLYASLQELFPEIFFAGGKIPKSEFGLALQAVVKAKSRRAAFRGRNTEIRAVTANLGIHDLLDCNKNLFFKKKSILGLYRDANWNPERIPDEVVPFPSALCTLRIVQTKQKTDPTTSKKVLEDTDLIRRARAKGLSHEQIIKMKTMLQSLKPNPSVSEAYVRAIAKNDLKLVFSESNFGSSKEGAELHSSDLLDLLKLDLINDISGGTPVLSE